MKKKAPILACALIFLLGMGIMFYPTVSNWVYEQTASYVISDYLEQTSTKTSEEAAELFAQASAYNETLTGDVKSFMIAEDNQENNELDEAYWNSFYDLNGIMGVIEIPSIDVSLPIYHGTDETTLVKGVGHLEGSALPTGEIGNHTVLTGHTGLPTAELFTDLDQLVIGDVFYVQILNKVFTYEVIEINVVLPSETEKLKAQEDKDLVTLVTCTPYGINSHRLLVRGERMEIDEEYIEQLSEEIQSTLENTQKTTLLDYIVISAVAVFLSKISTTLK